ncbi:MULTISPECIES: AfsR/SARP family transcriptional regulator [Streptomyces]|uniref:AfsR family transcriptional regulator n=1 Tax=Streptomyces griseocarneus TaxID=51201 RepID=A0ABX7RFJ0_9ACTN|nr:MULTISPECIES: BTAD domain-containing putative transcriptional regulator [Streptomyces]QSY46956.1 AfsR family transcriptional regulator [Streptomyces griseocarneus]
MTGEAERAGRRRLRFAVLGPVRAWRGDEPLNTGAPQQRALRAALLLRGGRTATAPELVDALWGEDHPRAAPAALRTYAARLRKMLGPDADALVSESSGYALQVGPGGLDIDAAERLAAEADTARGSGNPARARGLMNDALALWHGEPLAEVPGPYAQAQRARLAERRLSLLETRLALDLDVGARAESVSELTALTAAYPLRELLRELLMLALYRSDRRSEALAVYADTRRLLADELGVDPRPELTELRQRILDGDAGLGVSSTTAGGAPPGPAFIRPAQLPASVSDFTGRAAAAVDELGSHIAAAAGERGHGAVVAVAGIGGVGKTTLAVHAAHTGRRHFPDGQLYADLQGAATSPAAPEAVLGSFLRALGLHDSEIPDGLPERVARYRSVLADRRVLVLLDNARDASQVHPLLPGNAGCATLVTSRNRMIDLACAHVVDLGVMPPPEALELFTAIVGAERTAAEPDAAMAVLSACGFLPLAIRIAAARLASRRSWSVSVLARKLGDERRRLDELHAGDLAVTATFELGYALTPEQARAFRHLSVADAPDLSSSAAEALLGTRTATPAGELLKALVDTSLLETPAPGRYRLHDLVRLYARTRIDSDEQAQREADAATSRLLDFYLATAARVYALARPGDRLVHHLAPTHHPGLPLRTQSEAVDWLFTEARCLLATAAQACHSADPTALRRAVDLLLVSKDLAESGAHARLGSSLRLGNGLYALGRALIPAGRPEEAISRLTDSLEIFATARQRLWEGMAHHRLAEAHLAARCPAEAAHQAERALSLLNGVGGDWRRANTLTVLGRALDGVGERRRARACWQEALSVHERLESAEQAEVRHLLE